MPKTQLRLCDRCCQPLEREEGFGSEQFDNALIVQFDGGYSMFIDPIYNEDAYRAIICHECAHDLCELEPWMDRLLKPHTSHAHHVDKIDGLLVEGHRGWDLDKEREKSE